MISTNLKPIQRPKTVGRLESIKSNLKTQILNFAYSLMIP